VFPGASHEDAILTRARGNAAPRWSWRGLTSSITVGIDHVWSGADHMLFLVALLMTSVLRRTDAGWIPRATLRDSIADVVKVVTGFTLSHSITLSLAALGLLRPAARIIEPAIAASVAVAALENLRPFLGGRKWVVASSLGLLHGFGFASALNKVALPRDALVVTLCGFAIGVETGQLIFVSAFVPVAFVLRKTSFYRNWILRGGSLAIASVAIVWMVQRIASGG
jgi:hydrogenase/urease accessory protein HupE